MCWSSRSDSASVSAVVGSSNTMTLTESAVSTLAISTSCLVAAGSRSTIVSGLTSSRPSWSRTVRQRLFSSPPAHHPGPGWKPAHEHVLADRQVRKQAEFLVDGLHTGGPQRGGCGGGDRLALDVVAAAVPVQRSGEHPDQGGFPGAVLPGQAVHLAGDQLERHVAQRLHGSECFGDVGQFQDGRSVPACAMVIRRPCAVGGSSSASRRARSCCPCRHGRRRDR